MNKSVKIAVEIALLVVIALLAWLLVKGIMKPVDFNKQKAYRESVAIQRLKDIRTLQVAYKSVYGTYNASIDTLTRFYNEGEMSIVMQVGSMDDSISVAHTEAIKAAFKKKNRKNMTGADLYEVFKAGDKQLVFSVESKIPVRDTVFASRENFCIDSIGFIPFSLGERVEMDAITKQVSGVQVPLFEAKMPYRKLLKGLDNQLRINLDAEREDQNKYPGLQVGSVTAPNNNAGNWE